MSITPNFPLVIHARSTTSARYSSSSVDRLKEGEFILEIASSPERVDNDRRNYIAVKRILNI